MVSGGGVFNESTITTEIMLGNTNMLLAGIAGLLILKVFPVSIE